MKVLHTIRNYKASIAGLFVVSMLAVTACDVLCSIDRSVELTTVNIQTGSHHSHGAKKHHHDPAASHNHQAAKEDIATHTHSSASSDQDDDCCKDITSQFYKSLFNGNDVAIVKAPVNSFILFNVISTDHLLSIAHYVNPFEVLLKTPPNWAGHHLRILISSFLI